MQAESALGRVGWVLLLTIAHAVIAGLLVLAGRAMPADLLTYTAYFRADADLFLYDLNRAQRFNLTRNPTYEGGGYWSPDGRHLAFLGDRDGGIRVYALDTFTGASWPLTPDHGIYHSLRWVENGRRLIMLTGANEETRVFSVGVDGTDWRELTSPDITAGALTVELGLDAPRPSPAASADGRLRLVTRYTDSWGLYVVERGDLTSSRRLADIGRSYTEMAGWSPDNRLIAYISSADGQTDLYVTTLDGHPRRLTDDAALETAAAWRPVPPEG